MSDRDEADISASVTTSDLEGVKGASVIGSGEDEIKEFRGFERIPSVVVPRLDVSPFIPPKIKSILKTKSCFSDLDKFFVKCSVNIINHDLSKLKQQYSKNPGMLSDLESYSKGNMSLNCKICNKEYASEKKLLNHQENKHMLVYKPGAVKSHKRVSFSDKVVVHEVKEYHKCRKCTRIFESYMVLKRHMKEKHKKRKCYICNYCEKKFVDRMFFKVHIKLHCEACGLLFPSKTKCMDHKRFVCKIVKLHTCKICDISFFKIMDLKDHSYDHLDSCYVCDICKEHCPSKCAIAHHIRFLHSKRCKKLNPSLYSIRRLGNENLYLCKCCDESSVDKDIIETHIQKLPDLTNRAMTGYKDYYFCDQCFQMFDTEKVMLQHKWTHFLKIENKELESQQKEKEIKIFYNINEKIPEIFQPKLVLEKITVCGKEVPELPESVTAVDVENIVNKKTKAIIDPKSKKTIISKYQCENCSKYFSSNYTLARHVETQHRDYENLRCNVCEEVFVWPSLLQKHKCIRVHIPEIPFDDARPEIHFENLLETSNQYQNNTVTSTQEINGFDDLNIIENDDYLNSVDFDIPAPIVQLSECDAFIQDSIVTQNNGGKVAHVQSNGYKLVMQEVPIEF